MGDPYSIYVEPSKDDKYIESIKDPKEMQTGWKWHGLGRPKFKALKDTGWDLQPSKYKVQMYWSDGRWHTNTKLVAHNRPTKHTPRGKMINDSEMIFSTKKGKGHNNIMNLDLDDPRSLYRGGGKNTGQRKSRRRDLVDDAFRLPKDVWF